MANLPDLGAPDRAARIAEIRRQIAAGVYETPDKLEGAIEAFLDRSALAEPPAKSAPDSKPKPK